MGGLNYISQEASGCAYITHHARARALAGLLRSAEKAAGVFIDGAAAALIHQIILGQGFCDLPSYPQKDTNNFPARARAT